VLVSVMRSLPKHLQIGALAAGCIGGSPFADGVRSVAMATDISSVLTENRSDHNSSEMRPEANGSGRIFFRASRRTIPSANSGTLSPRKRAASSEPQTGPDERYGNISAQSRYLDLGQQFVRGALPCFGVWLRPGIEINLRDKAPPLVQGRREVCRATSRKFTCHHRSAYGSYTNLAKTYQCLKECAQSNECLYSDLMFENVRGGAKSALKASFSFGGVRVRCSFVDQSKPVNIDLYGDGLQTRHRVWFSMFICRR
jgi:hypothetical protein